MAVPVAEYVIVSLSASVALIEKLKVLFSLTDLAPIGLKTGAELLESAVQIRIPHVFKEWVN